MMHEKSDFELMQSAINVTMEEAGKLGIGIAVSAVDAGGHLVSFVRMEGVSFMAIEVTRRKAMTSVMFRMPSHALNAIANSDPSVAADLAKHSEVCLIAGGVPIFRDKKLIGAIGVAGGRSEQDRLIAENAVAKLETDA